MFIEKAFLFHGMSGEFMEEISKSLTHEAHAAGDVLFRAGDPAEFLYVIERGRIRLSAGNRGLFSQIVEKEGDALGWSSLVGREVYSSTAECLTDARLIRIGRDALCRIFDRHPACGLILFRRLARTLGERLVESYQQIMAAHGSKDPTKYGYGG